MSCQIAIIKKLKEIRKYLGDRHLNIKKAKQMVNNVIKEQREKRVKYAEARIEALERKEKERVGELKIKQILKESPELVSKLLIRVAPKKIPKIKVPNRYVVDVETMKILSKYPLHSATRNKFKKDFPSRRRNDNQMS